MMALTTMEQAWGAEEQAAQPDPLTEYMEARVVHQTAQWFVTHKREELFPDRDTMLGERAYRHTDAGLFIYGQNYEGRMGWMALALTHGRPPDAESMGGEQWLGFASKADWVETAQAIEDAVSPGVLQFVQWVVRGRTEPVGSKPRLFSV